MKTFFHQDAFAAPARSTGSHPRYLTERGMSRGRLLAGCAAGGVAALVGASCWAIVAGVAGMQMGWVAVLIGFIVGYAVRFAGQGNAPIFGFAAGLLAILGCLLGNILGVVYLTMPTGGLSYTQSFSRLDLDKITTVASDHFKNIDVIFYAISIYLSSTIAYGNERTMPSKNSPG